jgi:hypothetical protein
MVRSSLRFIFNSITTGSPDLFATLTVVQATNGLCLERPMVLNLLSNNVGG